MLYSTVLYNSARLSCDGVPRTQKRWLAFSLR